MQERLSTATGLLAGHPLRPLRTLIALIVQVPQPASEPVIHYGAEDGGQMLNLVDRNQPPSWSLITGPTTPRTGTTRSAATGF